MDKRIKRESFEYLLDKLVKWYDDTNTHNDRYDLTRIKINKLVFLVASVKDEKGEDLLDIFDNFVTDVYGPVDVDVAEFLQENKMDKYVFGHTYLKNKDEYWFDNEWYKPIRVLSDKLKGRIDNAVKALQDKNYNLIKLNPFDLVSLTTRCKAYQVAYRVGILTDKPNMQIPISTIREEIINYNL